MRNTYELSNRLVALISIDDASTLLKRKVGSDIQFLGKFAGRAGLDHKLTCRALAASYGFDILFETEMRRAILTNLSAPLVDEIWEALHMESDGTIPAPYKRREGIQTLHIHRGSYRARQICEILNLPLECAGDAARGKKPALEDFDPQRELPPLHDFQLELAAQINSALLDVRGDRRAMLALPTGGGKTRVVLETVLNWNPIENDNGTVLWVAQHEELCEQAIESVKQIWGSKKRPLDKAITVQRVWDGKSPEIDWNADVVVGIPKSLGSRILSDRAGAKRRLKLIVIDEAHLATSSEYSPVFQLAGVANVPILGISATPAKPNDPSSVLQQCFERRLLRAASLEPYPYEALRAQGILSDLDFEPIESGAVVEMSDDERESLRESDGDYTAAMLSKLGKNSARNGVIVDRLANLPPGVPTLTFACSVASAHALAAALTLLGREAAVVDASNSSTYRRKTLEAFKSGQVQFLFNYGVLATGFDAPSIACLLIARPTRSAVLMEQMIGRGLRGPKNGGTSTCKLLWIEDEFTNADELKPQSYKRFANLWKGRNG